MSTGKHSNSPMVAREIDMSVATGSKLCWWIAHGRRDEIFDAPHGDHLTISNAEVIAMLVAASIAAARCYDSMPHHCGPMEALWEVFEFDHRDCGDPFLFPPSLPFLWSFLGGHVAAPT